MEKLISVKTLAEELGVSKPTLFKRIDKLNLRSDLQKQGKALMIPEEVANKLREAYKGAEETSEKQKKPHLAKENEDITSSLVELLREELRSKNQLIENLQKQVSELEADKRELYEDNRRYMAMNTQLLLSGSGAPASKSETVDADYTAENEEERREEPQEEKKSFFRRLFSI